MPVAALVAGTLFASSVRASQGEDLRTDQAQLPDLIRAQTRTNENRNVPARRPAGPGRRATAALAPGDLQTQKLERQADEIAAAAGRTAVRGPALQVTLDDANLGPAATCPPAPTPTTTSSTSRTCSRWSTRCGRGAPRR